jgi:hypothetical protein
VLVDVRSVLFDGRRAGGPQIFASSPLVGATNPFQWRM